MKTIKLTIEGDKIALIKALTALQNAKINVVGVQVGNGAAKVKKSSDKAYKLASEYDGDYKEQTKSL